MSRRHTVTLVSLAAFASVSLGSARASAQTAPVSAPELPGTIIVQVTDTSLNPLRAEVALPAFGVDVQLPPEGLAVFLDVPDGSYLVEVRLAGYASQSRVLRVTGDTVRADFVLSPGAAAPTKPGPLRAKDIAQARLHYFIERGMTMGRRVFITRQSIERFDVRTVSGVLRTVQDVRVEHGTHRRTIVRSKQLTGSGCTDGMLVFVDGNPLSASDDSSADATARRSASAPDGGPAAWGRSREHARDAAMPTLQWVGPHGGDLVRVAHYPSTGSPAPRARRLTDVDAVRLSSVAAIEVYLTPDSVPPEFLMAGTECGVVLVWTVGA